MNKLEFDQINQMLLEAKNDAFNSGATAAEVAEKFPELKEKLLKSRGIELSEFDNFRGTNGLDATLTAVRENARLEKEQKEEEASKELRKQGLIERFRDKLPDLSKEELADKMAGIVKEVDRVYWDMGKKVIYTKELTDKLLNADERIRRAKLEDEQANEEYKRLFPGGIKGILNKMRKNQEI